MENDNNQNNAQVANDTNQTTTDNSSLDRTKQRALEALVALMPELNTLEPEQKFRICIDAIRFTDNQRLVDTALDAALAIGDSETRANALLEIVAEINYLEQPQEEKER